MMFCLAPLLLAGYALTVTTSWHKSPNVDAPTVQFQTCEQGLGAHFTMSGSGIYAPGIQYGFKKSWEHWSVIAQPFAGLAFFDHALGSYYPDVPESKKRFEVGFQFLVGYDHARLGVAYWHLSNAGTSSPNTGLDMIVIQTGWSF